ncbi:MAG: adenylyltransferase/cytidyltransferase family protein [Puniceicoccales bacterium]|jgi:rfaE bifunctional protein nucleotidyltransferase chain/domain|nr:adenylyltransferase/cytidyltransferase family protein [Puniceicoccales bacterium]
MEKLPCSDKLFPFSAVCAERNAWRRAGRRVVLTNGCFDLLHPGHLLLLEQAKALGDVLVVALNADCSVRALKGPSRPILGEELRAYALGCLRSVDRIFLFDGTRVAEEIHALAPDIYVRAEDRTVANLNSAELMALRAVGTRIEFVPFLPSLSTTALVEKICSTAGLARGSERLGEQNDR